MPRQSSIKKRIRAVILLACGIVLFVTAGALVTYDVGRFKKELIGHLSTLAAVVADNVRIPLAFENEPNAVDILSALKAEPGLRGAAIYDTSGKIFATYPADLETNRLPSRVEPGNRITDDSVLIFNPIIQENKRIGTLFLEFSLDGLFDRMRQYGMIVGIVLVVTIAGAFVVSTLLQKRISAPVLALSEAAARVAQSEDYSIRAPKLTDDEIGSLTDNFNKMLAETQEHHTRLTEQARLLDLSNDAIIVRQLNGRIVYWNRGAAAIYGWPSQEAIGNIKEELLQTQYPVPKAQIFEQLLRDGRWDGELIQTRRDGMRIHVITRWALDRDADGRPANVLISDNDITEQKKSEEALRESEERFRALGDNIPQLAWMTDSTGHIFWYNQRWYEYTGATFEDVQGWGWASVHHPDHLDRVREKWMGHLSRGENWEDTFPLRAKDGTYRWFLSRAFPIQDPQGTIVRWFGTNTDVTERKLSEEQLEELVRKRTAKLQETIGELEAFSYSVSHDMRAPLRAMQGYAKALLADYDAKLEADGRMYLERIVRASNRLDLLVQDVLAYSKVAQSEITLAPINPERLIEELLLSHPELQPPNMVIVIEKPLHPVCGHEAYLTQCITNLLGNAAKFVPPGTTPRVRIRSELVSGKVRLWFEDNGIGIEPAHQERIFQIFGQVHSEKKYGGTGIGLAIVRKAVQRMYGEVGVESELGKGSRFWILLSSVDT